jgi:NAD(P)-dependent dehydrogenase (short-subunit alcohol dehydrogenase family)
VIELGTTADALALALAEAGAAVVVAGAADPDAAAEELLDTCTAGPTSLCFPAAGSVGNPQLAPAVAKVLPYMRQIL